MNNKGVEMGITIFHGGCHDCTQQEINGIDFCVRCCCFDADWNFPNLNNREPSRSDLERARLKEKHNMGLNRDELRWKRELK